MNDATGRVFTPLYRGWSSCSSTCWDFNPSCFCASDNLLVLKSVDNSIRETNKTNTEEKGEGGRRKGDTKNE